MFSRTAKQILIKLPRSSGKRKTCREYDGLFRSEQTRMQSHHTLAALAGYADWKQNKIELNFASPEKKKLWHSAAVFYFETAAVIVSRLSSKRTFVSPHIPATVHQPRHGEDDVSSTETFGGSCRSLSALTSCWLKQKTKPSKCFEAMVEVIAKLLTFNRILSFPFIISTTKLIKMHHRNSLIVSNSKLKAVIVTLPLQTLSNGTP